MLYVLEVLMSQCDANESNERQILLRSNELPPPPWNAEIVKYSTKAVPLKIVIEDYIGLTSGVWALWAWKRI